MATYGDIPLSVQVHAHPCPNCGHCPTCGRSNAQPWGFWPWHQPFPYTTGDFPLTQYPTTLPYQQTTWISNHSSPVAV